MFLIRLSFTTLPLLANEHLSAVKLLFTLGVHYEVNENKYIPTARFVTIHIIK